MEEETFRLSWDRLQRQFQCCGTINFNTGYRDWKVAAFVIEISFSLLVGWSSFL